MIKTYGRKPTQKSQPPSTSTAASSSSPVAPTSKSKGAPAAAAKAQPSKQPPQAEDNDDDVALDIIFTDDEPTTPDDDDDFDLETVYLDEPPADNNALNKFVDSYHCNECDMEFESVDEHIKMYHWNQKVVIQDEAEPEKAAAAAAEADASSSEAAVAEGETNNAVDVDDETRCFVCNYPFESAEDRILHLHIQHNRMPDGKKRRGRPTKFNSHLDVPMASTNTDLDVPRQKRNKASATTTAGNGEEAEAEPYCALCNTYFQTERGYKLHRRMHNPIKPQTLEKVMKSRIYGTAKATTDKKAAAAKANNDDDDEDDAVANDAAAAADPTTFFCATCDKRYPLEFQTIHEKSHTTAASDRHRCVTCNIAFESAVLLGLHQAAHKTGRKYPVHDRGDTPLPFECTFCGKAFARPNEKVKHERVHTGEKPHGCEICGKTFRVAFCLTLHMRSHTNERPYVCPHCDKRFKSQSVYNHHLLIHSDARPYQCPMCPKAFKTPVQLAGHKNSHLKPFPCSECNRPFSTLYACRLHMKTHERPTNNMKHVCRLCRAAYTRAFALRNHMQEKHADAPDAGEQPPKKCAKQTVAVAEQARLRAEDADAVAALQQAEDELEFGEDDDEEDGDEDDEEEDDDDVVHDMSGVMMEVGEEIELR